MFNSFVFISTLVLSSAVTNTVQSCEFTEDDCFQQVMSRSYNKFLEANPAIGMEDLDPMFVDFVDGNLSVLKFKIYNSTMIGFKKCKIENSRFTGENKIHLELMCPKLIQTGQYEISGRLLVLPVEGKGDFNIETNKFHVTLDGEIKITERDGQSYFAIKNFKVHAIPLEPVKFDLSNLFNGQKELADTVLNFANENWKEVTAEVIEPVMIVQAKKIVTNANKYLKHVPIEELVKS